MEGIYGIELERDVVQICHSSSDLFSLIEFFFFDLDNEVFPCHIGCEIIPT